MRMPFGKYKDHYVAEVVVKYADYVRYCFEVKNPDHQMSLVVDKMKRLIIIFDEKPITRNCMTDGCRNKATKLFANCNIEEVFVSCWCNHCDPYESDEIGEYFKEIWTYSDAAHFVRDHYNYRPYYLGAIIRSLSKAKGLNRNASGEECRLFFKRVN